MQLSMFLSAAKQRRCPNQQPTNHTTALKRCQLFLTNFLQVFCAFCGKIFPANFARNSADISSDRGVFLSERRFSCRRAYRPTSFVNKKRSNERKVLILYYRALKNVKRFVTRKKQFRKKSRRAESGRDGRGRRDKRRCANKACRAGADRGSRRKSAANGALGRPDGDPIEGLSTVPAQRNGKADTRTKIRRPSEMNFSPRTAATEKLAAQPVSDFAPCGQHANDARLCAHDKIAVFRTAAI